LPQTAYVEGLTNTFVNQQDRSRPKRKYGRVIPE
jgi:hypothetical protein